MRNWHWRCSASFGKFHPQQSNFLIQSVLNVRDTLGLCGLRCVQFRHVRKLVKEKDHICACKTNPSNSNPKTVESCPGSLGKLNFKGLN